MASGGESLEYYTYLRQCEKIPTASATYSCGNFYTWVGSDATGYQLQSYYLKSTGVGAAEDPLEILRVEEYLGECDDANDALRNKNCKEFYNSEGAISYHLLKKTITCSNNCVDYRKTIPAEFKLAQVCKNIGGTWASPNCNVTSEQACRAIDEVWNPVALTCSLSSIAQDIFCSNPDYLDAVWDLSTLSCTKTDYKAIPEEGIRCRLSANGCREYTGNTGGNIMTVFNDNFESDSYIYDFPDARGGWLNGALSSESTDSDQKSFKVNSGMAQIISKWLSAECTLSSVCASDSGCDCLETATLNDGVDDDEVVCSVGIDSDSCMAADYTYDGGTYLLSFWAKGNNGNNITINITDGANFQIFGNVTLTDQWQEYTLGPLEFDVEGWGNYGLYIGDIKSNGGTPDSALSAFFDNVKLEAISDSIYVIKNSWRTPASCDRDREGNSYLYYMLGCDEYSDSKGSLHYLKSFTNLCRADAVGCEQLIDTYNFNNPFPQTWHIGDASEITVPANSFVYLAQTQDYSCMSSAVGCTALGQPQFNQDKTIVKQFDTVYKISDPDQYDTSLCYERNVGCAIFSGGTGQYFMKDPASQVCEYVQPTYEQEQTWYKKSDSYDINSEKCPVSDYQNFGVDFPSGTCVGGVENGKDCLPSWDNYLCHQSGGFCDSAGDCIVNGAFVSSCGLSACSAGGGYCGNWAGLCSNSQQSGCTAFVDPLSEFSVNLVSNNLFNKDIDPADSVPDGWTDAGGLVALVMVNTPPSEYVNAIGSAGGFFQEVNIEPNITYTLSADIKQYNTAGDDALVRIECLNYVKSDDVCPLFDDEGFYFVDDAGSLAFSSTASACAAPTEDRAELIISDSDLPDASQDFQRYSMRFFSGTCNRVQLSLGSIGGDGISFDNIALQETGIYYYLDGSLDEAKRECGGYVNSEQGCVLINNRNESSWSNLDFTSHLNYNADDMASRPTSCIAPNGDKLFGCNADTLLKVKPDRDCDKWLYCSQKRILNNENECCVKLNICDKMNEAGECVNNPLEYSIADVTENMTFNIDNIDKIKNLTGYSKVGFNWLVGGKVEGNLSPTQMSHVGSTVVVPNGDFESLEKQCTVVEDDVVGISGEVCDTDLECSPDTCETNNIRPTNWNRLGECSSSDTPCPNGDADCPLGANELCDTTTEPTEPKCRSNIFCDFAADCPATGIACPSGDDKDCPAGESCVNGFCAKTCDPRSWSSDAFDLVNNPVEAQEISIHSFDGANFLRLNAGSPDGINHVISDDIFVAPSGQYVLSGYINTKELGPVEASVFGVIQVLEVEEDRKVVVIAEERIKPRSHDLDIDSWKISDDGWVFVQMSFTTDDTSGVIRVKLGDMEANSNFCDSCSGSVYFDNITISSVLHAQNPLSNKQPLIGCRLYPESESLTCEYLNEDGYKYKGWYGYCLEHDPLYPEYCLNWYPVNTLDGAMNVCWGECVYGADAFDEAGGKFDFCVFE
jgi:hypothetical protein